MRYLLLLLIPYIALATQKVSLQLEWKHQFEYAGFYAAIEQGYYKEVGLELELREVEAKTDIVQEVLSGNSTFGLSSSSLILDKLQGKSVVLIASYFKKNALALITKPDIKSLKELKGKKIMLMPEKIMQTSLGVMLSDEGLNVGDYDLVRHDFTTQSFESGEVDAMGVFVSNELYTLDKKGVSYNIFHPSDYGIYFYDVELFTSEQTALNSPELVQKFRDASKKGWEYAFAHKEEIVDLIYEKYSQRKSKEALLYEAEKTHKLFKTNVFQIGSVIPESIALHTVIYERLKLVEKTNITHLLQSYIFSNNNDEYLTHFNQEELQYLKKHKTLRVANEIDWAPFDYNEFGKAQGLSIEYIELLLKKVGINYKFVHGYRWEELLALFKEGKIDLMPVAYTNIQREQYMNILPPYYQGEFALYSLANTNSAHSKTGVVGILESGVSNSIVQKHLPKAKVSVFKSIEVLMQALRLGKIDFVAENPHIVSYYIKENKAKGIKKVQTFKLDDDEKRMLSLHIGIQKDAVVLDSILQKVIYSLEQDEIKDLKQEWELDIKTASAPLSKEEGAYLKSKPIRMCIDPSWMPYEKLENGIYKGITADYFKIIQENIGVDIHLVETDTWQESIEKAKQRECDIFSLAMKTKEREEYMNFTTPYLNIPLVIATKPDKPFIIDFGTLENKKVGIVKGYAFIEILKKKYPKLKIVEVKNITEGLERVSCGELYGYIGTLASIAYNFQNDFSGELKIAGKFEENWELGIAVRNDDPILLSIFEKAIKQITESQSQLIMNKWLAIKYEKGVNYKLIWQIVFGAVIIVLIVLFWTRKLAVINAKLKIAKEKSDEAGAAKSHFLSNISHEIRTPMNSIMSTVYLMKETTLTPIQKKYIERIKGASETLLFLINDILDFSKIEAHKFELEKKDFNILEILNSVESLFKINCDEKAVDFKLDYDKHCFIDRHGDSLRLTQVLINLMSNAVKFTQEGEVTLLVEKKEGDIFHFEVKDTGIGLKEEQLNKIFKSFTQADSSITRKYGGTGLGLSIAKELIALMGGEIKVDSIYGKGSSFSFEIELEEANSSVLMMRDDASIPFPQEHNKLAISQEELSNLYDALKEAARTSRPQQCKPIIEKLEKYQLGESDSVLFKNIKNLIEKYKFDEVVRLLDEK